MYIYMSAYAVRGEETILTPFLDLYTVLPLLILHVAWHTRGESRGGHTLRDIVGGRNTGG